MKLNTLLLTSAATLMATSVAFAADLPSKKAAPAAGSVQVCKVGSMTGISLPGSGTCLGISGRVTFDGRYVTEPDSDSDDGLVDYDFIPGYRLQFAAATNTEIGVVNSAVRLTGGDFDKAYIQFSGLTVGMKDSIADIAGFNNNNLFREGNGSSAVGVDYKISAGGLTFGLGLEDPLNWNTNVLGTTMWSSDMPDIIGHVSGKAGPVGFAVAGVLHEAVEGIDDTPDSTEQGYALLGVLSFDANPVGVRIFGGIADGASAYLDNNNALIQDFNAAGTESSESTALGGSLSFKLGAQTTAYIEASMSHYENGTAESDVTAASFQITHYLAKGLSIQPEYYWQDVDNTNAGADTEGSGFNIRIQRDF